ncbi:alcohol dehydrogenase catalytic domain-containing protein [Lachnospiraceae bacterium 54-53]
MKSCVITSPFHYEIREIPIPEPGDDEVLIQMKAAGVCGSDLHIYRGENPCSSYPLVPGHENAGIVVKAGKNVTNVKEGDPGESGRPKGDRPHLPGIHGAA